MDFIPLIDLIGENATALVGGVVVGGLFGFFAQRSAFCTRSAVLDLTRRRDFAALATWAAGFAAAVLGVQLLLNYGYLDVRDTRFFSTAQSLSGALIGGILEPLSNLALPMGLMTVGAGLQLKALRGASLPFIVSSALKLVGFPLMTAGLALLLGLEGMMVQVAVLLSALPTATSAYILARQLGGDAPLMAGIISGQTLLAIVICQQMAF